MSVSEEPLVIMLLMMVILLVAGMFMESTAIITILTPVLLPIAQEVGFDPVHFGIIFVVNIQLGALSPPFGIVLFILSKVTGVDFMTVFKGVLFYYMPLLVALLIIILFPQLSLWVPSLVFGR